MNRLKSVFLTIFVTAAVVVTAVSVWQSFSAGASFSWLGSLITSLTIVVYFGNLYRFKTPRNGRHLIRPTIAIVIGVVVAGLGTFDVAATSGLPLYLALGLWLGWLIYVNWHSRLPQPTAKKLRIGYKMPAFTLKDEKGSSFNSQEFKGKTTLYLFYRGNWCPFCRAQIREIVARYQELADRGVNIVLVSPQAQKETQKLAQTFEVPMTFLVDEDGKVAKKLGIAHENALPFGMEMMGFESDGVLPTVLLVGGNGRLLYLDISDNYRIRPEPSAYLRLLDETATTQPG